MKSPEAAEKFKEEMKLYNRVKENLFQIYFTTVAEYLSHLKGIAEVLNKVDQISCPLFFLAAAVSDFYIPLGETPTHKIQSSAEPLVLTLQPVPKTLVLLTQHWVPKGYFVSFKLETDENILISKARRAIENYKVDLVVANELHSRYRQVKLVTKTEIITVLKEDEKDIEESFLAKICSRHAERMAQKEK